MPPGAHMHGWVGTHQRNHKCYHLRLLDKRASELQHVTVERPKVQCVIVFISVSCEYLQPILFVRPQAVVRHSSVGREVSAKVSNQEAHHVAHFPQALARLGESFGTNLRGGA